jgi:hypothetical protein
MRLNLGSGSRKLEGYVNVDKYGDPDLKLDLEVLPWPWETSSVSEVQLKHVLEHLGQTTEKFLGIIQELYRVCHHGAKVHIVVPHPRHDFFLGDPTHVRAITPELFSLFSKTWCDKFVAEGNANTPLAHYLNVNFDMGQIYLVPDQAYRGLPLAEVCKLEKQRNNVIEEYQFTLEVVK